MNIITSMMRNKAIDEYVTKKKNRWEEMMADLGRRLGNISGTVGEQLRYGPVDPDHMILVPAQWGASEVVKAASGRFVKTDGSGYLEIAGDGDSELVGWADHREETVSATEGGTKTQLNVDRNTLYKIPLAAGTLARTMFYDTADLKVASNIQGLDVSSADDDVVIIIDGDIANQKWAIVQINPAELGANGAV